MPRFRYLPALLTALLTALLSGPTAWAQTAPPANRAAPLPAYWVADAAAQRAAAASSTASRLTAYRAFTLDVATVRAQLALTPLETSGAARGPVRPPVELTLPLPDGTTGRFRVIETAVMAPALAARFPDIKTYAGIGLDDPTATLRCDVGPLGFHALVFGGTAGSEACIAPVSATDPAHYRCYRPDALGPDPLSGGCQVGPNEEPLPNAPSQRPGGNAGNQTGNGATARPAGAVLRTFRLAVAATGEFTRAHGGTVSGALAAIASTVNQVTGIYERELAVRLQLVANNNLVIFTDSTTDPYTNGDKPAMHGENQGTLDGVIGTGNYDVGQVFSSDGGGLARFGVVCSWFSKAKGTSGTRSAGDSDFTQVVAHELGHQFGAYHTFNSSYDSGDAITCGTQRSGGTAWEPGAGVTIMAYSNGRCGTDDLGTGTLFQFHAGSFEQIQDFIGTGSCAVLTATGNAVPTVSNLPTSKYLPKLTPFRLAATGADANGDAVTFAWDELDTGPAGPFATNLTVQVPGDTPPIFRSWAPTTTPERFFPRLAELVNNTTAPGEVAPTVTRALNFRLTVRDLHTAPGGLAVGGQNAGNVALNVTSAAGPFVVSNPNTANTFWPSGGSATVTWDVANTTAAPVSCATVNLLLSTDGGLTYPITLATNTPNDGSQPVGVPGGLATTRARVMVAAADNYFFDISNEDFRIGILPTLTSFSPTQGVAGTVVTLTGTNLQTVSSVRFGGVVTTAFLRQSATTLTVAVPAGASTARPAVTNPVVTVQSAATFTVGLAPTVGSFSPTSGPVGTSVLINGLALTGATRVAFGGVPGVITANTGTSLTATVPNGAPTGPVTVQTAFATGTSSTNFTVTNPLAPTISGFSPTSVNVGDAVTVTGTNLDQVVAAEINGEPATITAASATSLTLTVPNVSSGPIRVLGAGATVTSVGTLNVYSPFADLWAQALTVGGTSDFYLTAIARAPGGTVYVGGTFRGTATFGATARTATGSSTDSFVGALTPAGTWLWAEAFGGSGIDYLTSLAVDPQGNLTVGGFFTQTMTLGTTVLTANGTSQTAFVARRTAAGQWLWALAADGGGNSRVEALAVDAGGNAYVGGTFGSTGYSTTAPMNLGPLPLTGLGSSEAFVAKVLPTGQWAWATSGGGTGEDGIKALAVVPATGTLAVGGNSYAPTFGTDVTLAFGDLHHTKPNRNPQPFVAQLTSAGMWQWLASTENGGTTAAGTGRVGGIGFDPAGNVVAAGTFGGSIAFGPGASLTSRGGDDVFVTRLSGTTGALQWQARGGGTGNEEANAFVVRPDGRVAVGGSYTNATTAFGAAWLPAGGSADAFVANLTATGDWTWANRVTSTGAEAVRALTLDGADNVLAIGSLPPNLPVALPGLPAPLNTPNTAFLARLGNALPPAPTLTAISPTSARTGQQVTLFGTNLASVSGVTFNGVAATDIASADATTVVVRVPGGATSGLVVVTTAGGTAGRAFTVLGPTITGFAPTSGGPGTVVSLIGLGLPGATAVRFGGVPATVFSTPTSQILTAEVPAGAVSGSIQVLTPAGNVTSAQSFTLISPPVISGFSPTSGVAGTVVTVSGANLADVVVVTVGGYVVSITSQTNSSLTFTVPAGAPSGQVAAGSVGGTGLSAGTFTVLPSVPTITAFTPASGGPGTVVSVVGTDFVIGATTVTFDNVAAAAVTVLSATQLSATAPAGVTSGRLRATTAAGTAVSATDFLAAPVISGFSPTSGAVGTTVVISGQNLSGATSVTLNGTPAPITASSATSLSCTVPVGATNGLLAVTTPGGGPTSSAGTFTVTGGGGTGPVGWPQAGGGATADHAYATATDGQGNVYVAGHFLNTATFGSVTLTAPGGSQDAFLVKYDATGVVQWATRLGGIGSESIRGLTLDTNGQPYVTGTFANTFTYASAFGTQTLTNPNGGVARGFVAMGSSAGVWQWAVGFGSALPAAGTAIAINFSGNVTIAGTFQGTLALEGSALTLTSAGGTDGFAAQLNTGTGQWAWATRVGGSAYDALLAVTLDPQTGAIYAAGQFASNSLTTTPNSGFNPLASAGGADALIVRLNAATGAVAWLVQGGGTADDIATDVAVTPQGAVVVAAYGTGSATFGNNSINLPNGGGWAGLARLAAGGFWQQGLTTATCPPGNNLQTSRLLPDGTGGLTLAGFFGPSATFGATSLSTPVAAPFVARTTTAGTAWAWAQQATPGSNPSFAYGEGLALTPNGLDAYVVGAFTGTLTQNGTTLTAAGSADAFVARFTPPTGAPPVPPAPALSNLAPTTGPVGTPVTVTGTNLSGATGVTFGGVAASFSTGSATTLTATVPAGAGTGPVVVTTAGGASNGLAFTVTGAVAEPVITTVTPGHAPVGAGVVITGTGFTNATLVRFNGRPAVFSVNGGGTQLTATVPPDATTGPLAVTTPAGEAAASAPFGLDRLVTTVETLEFGSYYDVTITPTGAATLSSGGPNFGLAVAGTLRVQAGGSLDFNGQPVFGNGQFVNEAGSTLTLYQPEGLTLAPATQGDVQLTAGRTYSTDATYVFAGTGAAVTGAAFPATVRHLTLSGGNVSLTSPLAVRQVLRLTGAGNLLTNGRMLTLLSDATATAMLVNGGAGRVIGTATVERYITPNGVPGLGYRHLSSPTTASAVSDLAAPGFTPLVNPAFNALPYVAPPTAQFPNVFGYDETRGGTTPAYQGFATGWVSPTALTNVLTPGRGFTALLNGAVKPDFTGNLTQSDLTLNGLTRTGTGVGNDDKSGWQLLGNPFASPLNWDLVPVPTGLSASISVYQTQGGNNGLYLTRANGVGSLPDGLIPAAQGFFARVTGTGPVDLTLPSAARPTTYANPAHYRAAPLATDTRPLISLTLNRVGAPETQRDEAFVYFQSGATEGSDAAFDGAKPGRNTGAVPTLVSLTTTGDELAVNGLSPDALTTGTIVPLVAVAPTAGNYTLKVSKLQNFDGQPLTLVDGLIGTRYDLRTQPALTFRADQPGEIRGRFRLEFGRRVLGSGADGRATPAALQVWPNPAGATQTVQVSGLPANTRLQLLDATGRVVRTVSPPNPSAALHLQGLPPGVYVLRAGALTQRLVVE